MNLVITPSILAADLCNLERDLKRLENSGIKAIHIDIMDGNFVPNITFGVDVIKAIKTVSNMELDVHLMVTDPDKYISDIVDAGADCITVHQEACQHLYKTIYKIKSYGVKAGIALNPFTSAETVKYAGKLVNKVLVMTVEPGFGGQKFISYMIEKIDEIKKLKEKLDMHYDIQVDGGIDLNNVNKVVEAGATDIVIGSSIFTGDNIEKNIECFNEILTIKVHD